LARNIKLLHNRSKKVVSDSILKESELTMWQSRRMKELHDKSILASDYELHRVIWDWQRKMRGKHWSKSLKKNSRWVKNKVDAHFIKIFFYLIIECIQSKDYDTIEYK
jgi:hypothetical protein